MNSRESKFCKTYQAYIEPGTRCYYRQQTPSWYPSRLDTTESTVETVQSVQINMPVDRFYALLEAEERLRELLAPKNFVEQHPGERLWDDYLQECKIRNECPSVQIAYEKYLNLLDLVRGHYG